MFLVVLCRNLRQDTVDQVKGQGKKPAVQEKEEGRAKVVVAAFQGELVLSVDRENINTLPFYQTESVSTLVTETINIIATLFREAWEEVFGAAKIMAIQVDVEIIDRVMAVF